MYYIDPQLRDFIVFCLERRGREWPAIYDEMANVASQRLFRGLGYDELKLHGLSLAASKATILRQIIEYVATSNKKPFNISQHTGQQIRPDTSNN